MPGRRDPTVDNAEVHVEIHRAVLFLECFEGVLHVHAAPDAPPGVTRPQDMDECTAGSVASSGGRRMFKGSADVTRAARPSHLVGLIRPIGVRHSARCRE